MVRRAFDKAVRRKPPVVAANAGPMEIQLREGAVSRCAEAVQSKIFDCADVIACGMLRVVSTLEFLQHHFA